MGDFITDLDPDFFDELETAIEPGPSVFIHRRKQIKPTVPDKREIAERKYMKMDGHGKIIDTQDDGTFKVLTYEDGYQRTRVGSIWIN